MFEQDEKLIDIRKTLHAILEKYAVRMGMKYNNMGTQFTIENDIDHVIELYRVNDDYTITLYIDDCINPMYTDYTYQNILDFKKRNIQAIQDMETYGFDPYYAYAN